MSAQTPRPHDCYPSNERFPRCVVCAREMGTGEADRAWFAATRRKIQERRSL